MGEGVFDHFEENQQEYFLECLMPETGTPEPVCQ